MMENQSSLPEVIRRKLSSASKLINIICGYYFYSEYIENMIVQVTDIKEIIVRLYYSIREYGL
jgi:hypothetical protein